MKNILFSIFIIILFASCNSKSKDPIMHTSVELNTSHETQKYDFEQVDQITSVEEKKETREQLETMSIQDIINLCLKQGINIHVGGNNKNVGYFSFLSQDMIQWHLGSDGFDFFPYITILDDSNIVVEVFYFLSVGRLPEFGSNYRTGKYYISITKENLINQYLETNISLENYTITKSFEINKYHPEEIKFLIISDTNVFVNSSLQGERMSRIQKNTEVEVVNMFYNDQKDNFPFSVKIKTDKLTGWIDVNHVDFIKSEVKGTVNGIWLHNLVKNIIKEYGNRAVSGKIIGDSVPVRKTPTRNAEQLYILTNKTELYITEVSPNLEVINEIEAAWYKVYKFVEHYTKDMEPADYEIIGWIFGANLEIRREIDLNIYFAH